MVSTDLQTHMVSLSEMQNNSLKTEPIREDTSGMSHKLKVQYWPIDEVHPYPNNPRNNDEAVEYVANSIREFGWQQPLVVDTDGTIIAGHTRLKAAKRLGMDTVPVVVADNLTPAQVNAYRLADNKVAEAATWDMEALAVELEGLEVDFDMTMFDFDASEFDFGGLEGEPTEIVEDEVPEDAPSIVRKGDVWQLGRHRLMCGDSTDPAVIDRLMDGVKADMVFTDPPYGMKKESEGVLNDNLNYDDLLDFNRQWIPLTFGALKDNGSWYCWGIDEPLMDIYSNILKPMAKENKITFRNLITWNKSYLENGNTFNPFGASGSKEIRMYPIADEKCLFVMMGVQGADGVLDASETLGVYLKYMTEELHKSGLTEKDLNEICGYKSIAQHWTLNRDGTQKQPRLIQKDDYKKIQKFCRGNGNDAFKKEYEEIKKEYEEIKKGYYSTRAYFDNADCSNNVWNIEITKGKEKQEAGGHATPKPIALCSRAIKSSSREGEIVLDVFGGSGSTLIACEQLERTCYMMELDPHYCDIIIERWQNLTGETARKVESDG